MVWDGFGLARASPGMESPEPPSKTLQNPRVLVRERAGALRAGHSGVESHPHPTPLPHPPPPTPPPPPLHPHSPTPQPPITTAQGPRGQALGSTGPSGGARKTSNFFSGHPCLPGHRILAWSSHPCLVIFSLCFLLFSSFYIFRFNVLNNFNI